MARTEGDNLEPTSTYYDVHTGRREFEWGHRRSPSTKPTTPVTTKPAETKPAQQKTGTNQTGR